MALDPQQIDLMQHHQIRLVQGCGVFQRSVFALGDAQQHGAHGLTQIITGGSPANALDFELRAGQVVIPDQDFQAKAQASSCKPYCKGIARTAATIARMERAKRE